MSDRPAKRRRWPRWATWVLLLAVLLFLGCLFWEWLATEVCLRCACSSNPRARAFGYSGLRWLGRRAIPHLVPYLETTPTNALESRRFGAVASLVVHRWADLTGEEVKAVAPHLFSVSLDARGCYQAGGPVSYALNLQPLVVPYGWLRTWPRWVETVELVEGQQPVVSFRMQRGVTVLGMEPQRWLMPLELTMSWVQNVPAAQEMVRRLKEPGQHTLRVSLALKDRRLSEPVPVARFAHIINTVESLPLGSFVAVSDPVTDEQMKDALSVRADLRGDRIPFTIAKQNGPPVAFAGRAVVRVRETGEEFDGGLPHRESIVPGQPFDCVPVAWFLEDLHLEPGRTYHLRVVYKPDPSYAWLDPRITTYWDGEIESNWVEVTVPEAGPAETATVSPEESEAP